MPCCGPVDQGLHQRVSNVSLLTSIHMHHGYRQQRHGRHLAPKTTLGGEMYHLLPYPPPQRSHITQLSADDCSDRAKTSRPAA